MSNIKGPSLDAIRRFKEQQERKKREEDERKIKEKLNTLEHRSTHGDRKAKSELKKIRDTIDKPPEASASSSCSASTFKRKKDLSGYNHDETTKTKSKPKPVQAFDFDKLMEIAQQNTNREKTLPSTSSELVRIPKKKPVRSERLSPPPAPEPVRPAPPTRPKSSQLPNRGAAREAPARRDVTHQVQQHQRRGPPPPHPARDRDRDRAPPPPRGVPPSRNPYPPDRNPYPPQRHMAPQRRQMPPASRYEDEDDYESDGFVVSDGEEDAQAELRETLKSVFRYDRRRCDLREQELDRQYRAIGNVSTFEDLEREERRASRLAALEDAREQREEEERKRLKKIRLDKAHKESGGGRR